MGQQCFLCGESAGLGVIICKEDRLRAFPGLEAPGVDALPLCRSCVRRVILALAGHEEGRGVQQGVPAGGGGEEHAGASSAPSNGPAGIWDSVLVRAIEGYRRMLQFWQGEDAREADTSELFDGLSGELLELEAEAARRGLSSSAPVELLADAPPDGPAAPDAGAQA